MIVESLRFGPVEVPEKKIISMEKPILGFEHLQQFVLIEIDEIKPPEITTQEAIRQICQDFINDFKSLDAL